MLRRAVNIIIQRDVTNGIFQIAILILGLLLFVLLFLLLVLGFLILLFLLIQSTVKKWC